MNTAVAAHHAMTSPAGMVYALVALVLFLGAMVALVVLLRKTFRSESAPPQSDWSTPKADAANPSAFVTASMQGVIEKLRAQEKELARLHLLAQERAQESERLTEEVTSNMPTGLLLVSATGAISSANPAAEEALGIRALRYRSYTEILRDDSALAQMLTACLREGTTFHRSEIEHLTPHGEARKLGVTISPTYRATRKAVRARAEDAAAAEAKATGALCLMSDLTELAALQKQMAYKENLAALGEMSAGIAHEFKNALATISGYAQLIRQEASAGEVHDSAERIYDQTRALARVVTEFLRFAKPLEITYEIVTMQALVERVARETEEALPGSAVVCEGLFAELPGDEGLLRQALLNLARNGAEAARASGVSPRVTIFGTLEDLGGRPFQRIRVSDNGPGIPDSDLPKIFLPFYTTKTEGTGLGLAVVQKIALQHGGSIEARNQPAGGAEFLLWLPLRQEPTAPLFPSRAARI